MRWVILISFCVLSFVVGYMFGSINWQWMKEGHNNEVAFMAMVGGWISGLATLAAVIVSLWMAYQASQNNVEKILIEYKPVRVENCSGTSITHKLAVKSLRSVITPIMKFSIQIDGVEVDLAPVQMGRVVLPYTLHQQGEEWKFETYFALTVGWMSVFQTLTSQGDLKFKKGYFIVETAMRSHRKKIPNALLNELKELKQRIDSKK